MEIGIYQDGVQIGRGKRVDYSNTREIIPTYSANCFGDKVDTFISGKTDIKGNIIITSLAKYIVGDVFNIRMESQGKNMVIVQASLIDADGRWINLKEASLGEQYPFIAMNIIPWEEV